ncbi:MAG: prephenate dehydrogenase [Halanaerobiaceae bacterium]
MSIKLGIIGLGLMGGSLGLALGKYKPSVVRYGRDLEQKHESYALKEGLIDHRLTDDSIQKMDYIFIAVPVKATINVLQSIIPFIHRDKTIITDMGSTKSYICRSVQEEFPAITFVGGHPMTGREKSGPQYAREDLFRNKNYVLIKNNEGNKKTEPVKKLSKLLSSLKCCINFFTPQEHDRLVALTSHLPHVVAFSLMNHYLESKNRGQDSLDRLVGSGFLDMTRIAASSSEMWLDILATNRDFILQQVDEYSAQLDEFRTLIAQNDQEGILDLMKQAKEKRERLEREIGDGN